MKERNPSLLGKLKMNKKYSKEYHSVALSPCVVCFQDLVYAKHMLYHRATPLEFISVFYKVWTPSPTSYLHKLFSREKLKGETIFFFKNGETIFKRCESNFFIYSGSKWFLHFTIIKISMKTLKEKNERNPSFQQFSYFFKTI